MSMKVGDIINGHFNEVLGRNESLSEQRLKICKTCPLYKEGPIGAICNPNLYINKDKEVSDKPKLGFTRGCGCRISAKTRVQNAHCIINLW